MRFSAKTTIIALILVFLALLPELAGKLWPWQALLTSLVAALAVVAWSIVALLPKRTQQASDARKPQGKRSEVAKAAVEPVRPSVWRPDAIDVSLAVFVAWQMLSWGDSVYRFATAVYCAKVLAYAAVFWLLRYGLQDRRLWRGALWALLAGGMLLAVLGLREYVRTVYFLGQSNWRIFGPMFNPNAAASYLLLTIFPALALLFGAQSRADGHEGAPRYSEIAGAFAVVAMFVALLLTGSKAALVALLLSVVVFAMTGFSGSKARTARWVALGVLAATLALAFTLPPIRVRLLSAFGEQSNSSIFRAFTWQATLKMIAARPLLGFGGGAFEYAFPRYAIAGFTRAAHQSFLQLAAECGLPALLAGLTWAFLLLRGLYRAARTGEALPRLVAAGAIAALIASALHQMVDYNWYVPAVGLTFFALAGLGLAPVAARQEYGIAVNRRLVRAALLVALLLAVWSGKNLWAEVLAAKANSQALAMSYAEAADTYRQAMRLNPGEASFYTETAKLEEALGQAGDREALARAVQARRAAVRLQSTEPVNYLALSRLYELQRDLPAALQAAQQTVGAYPNYPRGLAQLGHVQWLMGQKAEALATYRRLDELWRSPVGLYPPVMDLVETAYAQGWMALGDAAQAAGKPDKALFYYSEAADLLDQAIATEQGIAQQVAAAGQGSWGHVTENTATARVLLQRLQSRNDALAVMRLAQLHLAVQNRDDGLRLLRYLIDGKANVVSPADRLAVAWATLRLAKELVADRQEEGTSLTKKGVTAARMALQAAPPATELAQAGWLQWDAAALQELLAGAEKTQ